MKISFAARKYIYWSISFISLVVILMSAYYQLGGFEEPKFGLQNDAYYSIAGKWLKGDVTRKEEGVVFEEMRNLIVTEKIKGVLCLVDYKNDTLAENEICRFVGVRLNDEVSSIPSGLEILEIEGSNAYQAALTMHPLVMPNSKKIEDFLQSKAEQEGQELDVYTMELYFDDNSVIIQMFSK